MVERIVVTMEPFVLTGRAVVLEPLRHDHADALAQAARGDRSTYRWTTVPDGPEGAATYVAAALELASAGASVPFVQRRTSDARIVGSTRLGHFAWWRGRPFPDEVEIGGTWLAADAQRSGINTEAKLLLMTHAFETWGSVRVAICTDARNTRSRAAIERLGARFEGVLRNHRPSHVADEAGRARDSAMFAVTSGDWPGVKTRLEEQRDRSR